MLKTRADSPELRKAAMAIEQAAWASLGFLNFTRAHFAFYQQVLDDVRTASSAWWTLSPVTRSPSAIACRSPPTSTTCLRRLD
ncbi:MAG: hypothetical protein R3C16_08490 [Hyphomonadaceae bacterium]